MMIPGYYRPDPAGGWVAISDHQSRYVDGVSNPWDEWELGLRVHDEFIAIVHDGGGELGRILYEGYRQADAGEMLADALELGEFDDGSSPDLTRWTR